MVKARPRMLRKNATDAENRLWYVLRGRALGEHKFVRQLAVGPYIVDFACRKEALILEVDGGQHAEDPKDACRTAYLNGEGYGVLRFWNNEIMGNRAGVLASILEVIAGSPSPDLRFTPATLSPLGRGTKGSRAAAGSTWQRTSGERGVDDVPSDGQIAFFSPTGRRWRDAPDEGGEQ